MIKNKKNYEWIISTIFRGETDILELWIMYYYKKVKVLNIGLHNPSDRVKNIIEKLISKNNIKNINLFYFNSDLYCQEQWVNEIYQKMILKTSFDIYAHLDIDEFIYRFDIIETFFKPDLVIKMPSLDLKKKNNDEIKWVDRDPFKPLMKEQLWKTDKVLYCVGRQKESFFYKGGQHDIEFKNDLDLKSVLHIEYPCIYHIPYRNEIQAYSKISNLLDSFTKLSKPIDKTWGRHVFERFIKLHIQNYKEIFYGNGKDKFIITLNNESIKNFAFQSNIDKSKWFEIDTNFYKKYILKYYNENNSIIDFIEQDFINKLEHYKFIFNSSKN